MFYLRSNHSSILYLGWVVFIKKNYCFGLYFCNIFITKKNRQTDRNTYIFFQKEGQVPYQGGWYDILKMQLLKIFLKEHPCVKGIQVCQIGKCHTFLQSAFWKRIDNFSRTTEPISPKQHMAMFSEGVQFCSNRWSHPFTKGI